MIEMSLAKPSANLSPFLREGAHKEFIKLQQGSRLRCLLYYCQLVGPILAVLLWP